MKSVTLDQERRIHKRINVHIVLEMNFLGEKKNYYGYIENISEGGMCVVSLEPIELGAKVTSGFYISDFADKLNPIASVVHTRVGEDTLYYHGLRFEYMRERDREALNQFLSNQEACVAV